MKKRSRNPWSVIAAAHAVWPSPSGTQEPIEADFAARLQATSSALGDDQASRYWLLGSALPPASTRARVEA